MKFKFCSLAFLFKRDVWGCSYCIHSIDNRQKIIPLQKKDKEVILQITKEDRNSLFFVNLSIKCFHLLHQCLSHPPALYLRYSLKAINKSCNNSIRKSMITMNFLSLISNAKSHCPHQASTLKTTKLSNKIMKKISSLMLRIPLNSHLHFKYTLVIILIALIYSSITSAIRYSSRSRTPLCKIKKYVKDIFHRPNTQWSLPRSTP